MMDVIRFESANKCIQKEQEGNSEEKHDTQFWKLDSAEDYQKLKAVHDLHKKAVCRCTHDAMSPISAISGYLELMHVCLQKGPDAERVERYRTKIEEGINELNEIMKKLNESCNEEDSARMMTEGRRAS